MPDARTLATDPNWFPDVLDAPKGVIRFARIARDALSAEAFLDQRKNNSVTAWADCRIDDIAPHVPKSPAPAFIYHSAFCGSTLLARALDAPGAVLSLKEPNILIDLVNARRVTPALQSGNRFEQIAGTILGLLSRPHVEGERVLIKPTNSASPLAALTNARGMPAIFLYGELRDFLISMLKKGEPQRAFIRQQFNIFALDPRGLSQIAPRQAMSFTDLQVAALVWRHQLEEFERMLQSSPNAASLNFASLTASRDAVLRAVARHLSLPLNDQHIDGVMSGAVFQTHSKVAGEQYDAATRKGENEAIESRYENELKLIEDWIGPISLGVNMKPPLSRALKF